MQVCGDHLDSWAAGLRVWGGSREASGRGGLAAQRSPAQPPPAGPPVLRRLEPARSGRAQGCLATEIGNRWAGRSLDAGGPGGRLRLGGGDENLVWVERSSRWAERVDGGEEGPQGVRSPAPGSSVQRNRKVQSQLPQGRGVGRLLGKVGVVAGRPPEEPGRTQAWLLHCHLPPGQTRPVCDPK